MYCFIELLSAMSSQNLHLHLYIEKFLGLLPPWKVQLWRENLVHSSLLSAKLWIMIFPLWYCIFIPYVECEHEWEIVISKFSFSWCGNLNCQGFFEDTACSFSSTKDVLDYLPWYRFIFLMCRGDCFRKQETKRYRNWCSWRSYISWWFPKPSTF